MEALRKAIKENARYLGNGIIKADAFINHQLLPELTTEIGHHFAEAMKKAGISKITRIVTAEVSGIAPALATAQALNVPMVFARKKRPSFMTGQLYSAEAKSRTKSEDVSLHISSIYLHPDDRVMIIDDFLATASTLMALVSIVKQSGATLEGVGCVIEKVFENGRTSLEELGIPVIALARIDLIDDGRDFQVL
ncbi:Xanthine phosphoribosyltransferase [Desulfamplus magnetovallimortis]|uniref:Xanthine phosphoribosyltransferase n=1 Tax=Desulfamplus magnetovallimortis TaxID=1246637 RepID=A0A1W1HGN2_9BACT|nr:xanthine phosphoribosyltransferase [Desulfamplus magnetovallimortis]SLM31634.1 Xanthine phosphoribosyltransferase [Desulfamplus magnetovallimortis]